jgi:hypothetical protein
VANPSLLLPLQQQQLKLLFSSQKWVTGLTPTPNEAPQQFFTAVS